MEEIITLIQTVGFPIACAIAMFLMLNGELISRQRFALLVH